jgi:hypothetical protein
MSNETKTVKALIDRLCDWKRPYDEQLETDLLLALYPHSVSVAVPKVGYGGTMFNTGNTNHND